MMVCFSGRHEDVRQKLQDLLNRDVGEFVVFIAGRVFG